MPCYNDETTIASAIVEALRIGKTAAAAYELLICNDASTDSSGKIVQNVADRNKQIRVLTHLVNKGYGATVRQLYYEARYEWLFSIPGDYQIRAGELMKLLPYAGTADMIIGWRVNRQDPAGRKRQSKIYNTLLRNLFGLMIHDVNSVRLMRTSVLRKITLESQSAFVDAELAIRMNRKGMRVVEVPIDHQQEAGAAGGGGNLRTILPTVNDMVKFWMLRRK